MPASPTTVTMPPTPRSRRSSAARRAAISAWRPTSGESRPTMPRSLAGTGDGPATLKPRTGSALPLSAMAPRSVVSNTWQTSLYTSALINTIPGSAALCRRLARLTVSPVMTKSPSSSTRLTTRPVWMPMRSRKGDVSSPSLARRRLRLSNAPCIASAAWTARSASSSWVSGTPKTANTASPMYFSTLPP